MGAFTLLLVACFTVVALQVTEGTFCSKSYDIQVKKTKTIEVDCDSRRNSGVCRLTGTYYKTEERQNTTSCCTGWKGERCNTPVCKTSCKVCLSPNSNCYSNAAYKCPWNNYNNCYPGRCGGCRRNCPYCSAGFGGVNCINMRDSPKFPKCQLSVVVTSGGKEKTILIGKCGQEHLYSNYRVGMSFVLDWMASYDPSADIPNPTTVKSVKFGVVSSVGEGTVTRGSTTTIIARTPISCLSLANPAEPVQPLNCTYTHDLGTTAIEHGHKLHMIVDATSGGYKRSLYYSNRREDYNGVTGSRTVTLTFDLQRPTHCNETTTCIPKDKLLIDVGPELDKEDNPTRYVAWSGWTDSDSGIETFSYKVYALTPDSDNRLTEKPSPVFAGTQPALITSTTAVPTYTLPGHGMYSVVLEVTDSVGNTAVARSLLLWDSQSAVSTNPKRPMSVLDVTSVTEEGETYVWVTSLVDKDHPVTVIWPGHFENTFHHINKLLNEVKPGKASEGLDDNHGDRTVNAIQNVRGIVKFHAGYSSLKSGEPSDMTSLGLVEKYKLQATVANGEHIRVFVKATDVMGNSAGDSLVVRVDSTAPIFVDHTFEKNVDCSDTKLSYCSRIILHMHDKESGLKAIRYIVTDVTQDKELWNGTSKGEQPTKNIKSCQDDGSCVCTPFNGCYLRDQVLYFDHCWLVNRVEHPIRVKVTIYNHAGLSNTFEIKLGVLNGLEGIDKCVPSTGGPSTGVIVGIVIVILLLLVLIILLILFCIIRRRQDRPYIPDSFADFNRTLAQSNLFWGKRANTSNFKNKANLYEDDYANDYEDAYDDDISVYGNMDTEDVAAWKIPAGNVVLGDKLPNAKGRFADIHSATLKSKGGRQNIVAKTLKPGGNAESKLLMTAKMNFWATACPKHENILLCLGAVPKGPILLFELCDLGTLGSWLVSQNKVTEDLEDKMITFSLHIARGLQELHAHKVIHRRLGVRNILLKSDNVGGIVAKVAGFGPVRGEVQRGDNADETIPVKWMSPEQLNLTPGQRRKYNVKTDVWTFGITLWEIFSKGGSPYPDIRSRELKKQLSNGYRMSRPTHCPDAMFQQVIEPCWRDSAPSRPTVTAIVTKIEKLFLSGAAADGYYTDGINKAYDPDV